MISWVQDYIWFLDNMGGKGTQEVENTNCPFGKIKSVVVPNSISLSSASTSSLKQTEKQSDDR